MKKIILGAFALLLSMSIAQAQTIHLSEDFENGIPATWSQSTLATDGGWNAGTGTSLSSAAFTIPNHTGIIATNDDGCNCDKSADSIFTDTIDLTSATGVLALRYDLLFSELTYQGATESLHIVVYSENSGTWSQLEQVDPTAQIFVWDDEILSDLSAYAGDKIVLGFVYNDGGGWTYGAALDNVTIFSPSQYDVSNLSVDNEPFLLVNTSTSIEGTIKNLGTETITDLEMSYTVDGGSAVTATITGLSIDPFETATYSHPTDWTPTVEQLSTVVTNVVSINGNNDANSSNDEASTQILVHPTPVDRKPLLEQFTSSTCAPCLPGNANVLSVMSAYTGEFSKVNYQMSWPGSGDPYFTLEGQERRTFYDVNSVPSMHTDGSAGINSQSYTSAMFEDAQDIPAFVNMSITATVQSMVEYEMIDGELVEIEGSRTYDVSASVDLNPVVDMPAGLRAMIAVNENLTYENVKTNGETEFHDVMKKMLPNANGVNLNSITAGSTFTVEEDHTFPGTYRLPNDAGDPIDHVIEHSVEEWDDLRVVAWVQDPTTGEIWQSENAEVEMLEESSNVTTDTVDGEVVYTVDGNQYVMFGDKFVPLGIDGADGLKFSIYPNPSNERVNIGGVNGEVNVQIYDANGRIVKSVSTENHTIGLDDLVPGIYMISIENHGIHKMEKLTIIR
ncbi:MAG: T9SS type A sorting domain-containing protein [Salibacteraceae bacterium]